MPDNNKVRVSFDFTKRAFGDLEKLQEFTNAGSKAEVIRNALRLYSRFSEFRADGWDVHVKKGNEDRFLEIL